MRERRKRKTETANTRMDITLSCFARAKERVDKRRERGEGREWRRHSFKVLGDISACAHSYVLAFVTALTSRQQNELQ